MKKSMLFLFSGVLLAAAMANANIRDLNALTDKATGQEAADLDKLLDEVTVVPVKDVKTGEAVRELGKTIFKVTKVQKGSVYEREGLKPGDLVFE